MDDSVIQALMQKFGMEEQVARNQPPSAVQGARRGVSRGSTNADERAKMRQMIETMEPDEYGEVDALEMGPVSVDEAPTDGMIEDKIWKTIQEIDPADGAKFYQMPGKEAFAALDWQDEELAKYWDRIPEEDRYFVIKALASQIDLGSSESIINEADEERAATEKSVIDTMTDMNK